MEISFYLPLPSLDQVQIFLIIYLTLGNLFLVKEALIRPLMFDTETKRKWIIINQRALQKGLIKFFLPRLAVIIYWPAALYFVASERRRKHA